jgi:hypothetical protein
VTPGHGVSMDWHRSHGQTLHCGAAIVGTSVAGSGFYLQAEKGGGLPRRLVLDEGVEAMVGGGILMAPAIGGDDGGALQRGEKEGVRFARESRAATDGGNGSPNEVDGGGSRTQNPA